MTRCIRHAAAFCLLLLVALLVNAARVQVFQAEEYNRNPANRRDAAARYAQPRGDIYVGGRPVTGSRETGRTLRWERTYTDGPLYAPVTGFASHLYGTSLLEDAEDALLSGADPRLAALPLLQKVTRGREPGGQVRTTVRPAAQKAAFAGLGDRRGAVVAIEPATGRILALASSPSYDPGRLAGTGVAAGAAWRELTGSPAEPMLNRALRQTYHPGAAFTVVTAAAALDAGVVTDVHAPGDAPAPYAPAGLGAAFADERPGCRGAGLLLAFQESCTAVFGRLGVEVGAAELVRTARKFGFGDGRLRIPSRVARSTFAADADRTRLALSAVGRHRTAATPLQMAMVASAVANGGDLMRPHLVSRVTTASGRNVARSVPQSYRQAMNPATATQLKQMMTAAVTGGAAAAAAFPGAEVGGGTGSARQGDGGSGAPYAWFIGWARAPEAPVPAVAVAVVVEDAEAGRAESGGGGNGGDGGDAAPIAREVMRSVLERPGP
ncbi:penicillin-binding transpeptidase domain-containing protein [Streptomyces sp. URMC 123]|uniref:penicillin-binding transpeptidase domain-containing protein n=1 Tax=Streptomyces sp. URMC 123 TaxID=3423403 RepID=UPI003F1A5554